MEKPLTIPQLARLSGYKPEFIRQATCRAEWNNPLKCTKSGLKRPVKYIRPSVFMEWLKEEETRCTRR